ncbi:DUF1328 domain-containing protein [Burkholderia gladioli]|uniref:DUF1328 domain-containing protein n=1 Tax=Burkholderia gladioli TaxID=28095 RepID=UPI0016415D84|nr:DUF1328 domain-containing protein [Burkholderia gladioli]
MPEQPTEPAASASSRGRPLAMLRYAAVCLLVAVIAGVRGFGIFAGASGAACRARWRWSSGSAASRCWWSRSGCSWRPCGVVETRRRAARRLFREEARHAAIDAAIVAA